MLSLCILSLLCGLSSATKGVDVSQPVSTMAFECMKSEGYTFAIVRVHRSTGVIDANGAQTIKNARAAGIQYVDGYIFPCKRCGLPKDQIKATIKNLKEKGAKIGQLWIDVEGHQYWSNDKADNVRFIRDLVDETKAHNVTPAMYTSKSQWGPIAGENEDFKDLQLWYARYNNKADFDDFASFGGWTQPTIKQYAGDQKL